VPDGHTPSQCLLLERRESCCRAGRHWKICAAELADTGKYIEWEGEADGALFKVPRPDAVFSSYAEFKVEMSSSQPELEERRLDAAALYTMERGWPVPRPLAARIRQLFFPEKHRGNEQLFLARLCLGREQRSASRFFSPLNFPLDTARLQNCSSEWTAVTSPGRWAAASPASTSQLDAMPATWSSFLEGGTYARRPSSALTSIR
jgi:hypothetical protein